MTPNYMIICILLEFQSLLCQEFLLDRVGPEKQKSQEREDENPENREIT